MKTYIIQLADDEVLVALKRGEGYEDTHPDLITEDVIGDRWPEYRTIHGADLRPAKPDDFMSQRRCCLSLPRNIESIAMTNTPTIESGAATRKKDQQFPVDCNDSKAEGLVP